MLDAMIAEIGYACARDHGDGIWYQRAYPYATDLCAPTFDVGYRVGGWTFGYRDLVRTSSRGQGVEDVDYDVGQAKCLRACDTPATYVTSGRVYGIYAEYEWRSAGWRWIAGALVFIPEHEVTVSGWDETGPVMPTATYVNPREPRVTPYVGAGYQFAPHAAVVARYYPFVKGAGDNGFESRATLYNGPLLTVSVRYEF